MRKQWCTRLFMFFLVVMALLSNQSTAQKRNLILKPVTATIGFFNGPRNAITFQSMGGGAEYLFKNMSSLRFNLAFGSIYKDPLNFYLHDLGGAYTLKTTLRSFGLRLGALIYKGYWQGYAEKSINLGKMDFPIHSMALYIGVGRSNYSLFEDKVFNNIYIDAIIVPAQNISNIGSPTSEYVFDRSNKDNSVPGHVGFRIGYESVQLNKFGIGVRPELIVYPGGIACLSLNFYLASGLYVGKKEADTDFYTPGSEAPAPTPTPAPEPKTE